MESRRGLYVKLFFSLSQNWVSLLLKSFAIHKKRMLDRSINVEIGKKKKKKKRQKPSGLLEWFSPNLQLKLSSFSEVQGIIGLYRNKGRTFLLTNLEIYIVCEGRITSVSDDCSQNGLHQRRSKTHGSKHSHGSYPEI